MARTLAAFVAALAAALTLASGTALAEPQAGVSAATGQPLNIVPLHRQIRKIDRTAEHPAAAMAPQHVAHRQAVRMPPSVHDGRAVQKGQDTGRLLAMLPWWRADPMETIRYLDYETGSGVLAAAEAWLGRPIAESHVAATGQATQRSSVDDASELDAEVGVANADELNAMDLAAVAVTVPRKADASWLHALLAMLGGALAAASTARYLFG